MGSSDVVLVVTDVYGSWMYEVYGRWLVRCYAESDGVGRRSGTLLDLSMCQGRVRMLYVVVGTLLSCGCSGGWSGDGCVGAVPVVVAGVVGLRSVVVAVIGAFVLGVGGWIGRREIYGSVSGAWFVPFVRSCAAGGVIWLCERFRVGEDGCGCAGFGIVCCCPGVRFVEDSSRDVVVVESCRVLSTVCGQYGRDGLIIVAGSVFGYAAHKGAPTEVGGFVLAHTVARCCNVVFLLFQRIVGEVMEVRVGLVGCWRCAVEEFCASGLRERFYVFVPVQAAANPIVDHGIGGHGGDVVFGGPVVWGRGFRVGRVCVVVLLIQVLLVFFVTGR